jgi:hypothetical protein
MHILGSFIEIDQVLSIVAKITTGFKQNHYIFLANYKYLNILCTLQNLSEKFCLLKILLIFPEIRKKLSSGNINPGLGKNQN